MWIEEYIKLHFPLNPDDMEIEKAIQLKQLHIPNALYRYRSFNDYSIENLINEQEWQSYPSEFNDPFDASMKIDSTIVCKELFLKRNINFIVEQLNVKGIHISEEQLEIIRVSHDPLYKLAKIVAKYDQSLVGKEEEFAKVLSEIVINQTKTMLDKHRLIFHNGFLVVCFSELKDSVLMWSHYASYHTGFCIEYNFKELGPLFAQSRILNPVIYTDNLFDATQYILQPLIREDHSFNNLYGIYPSICKSTHWEYEKEWRTVFPLGPNASSKDRFIRVPKPKAICLGAKASLENNEKLREIAHDKKIPLYQMKLSEVSHELTEDLIYAPF